ncbi:MAG: LysR family transcriptional regulator [Ottowia sp.]|jgi:DNA-binding transcriptional LysR family regulator|nr:LysR family transcriptional regulator [Ottowia sp.]MBP7531489.1 LysR family transcriptional regulator [Ottowia sp.]MBP7538099.1 LysR family transcriptional regulator [Ottowia sp.]HRL36404.1 LysR family transcriptional regulator [Ottowia beijingensis]
MRDLDLTSLRLFVAVCETRNIARAAEQQAIVGSAISKRLAALEDTVGTPLLVRRRHGVAPTPAGETLLEHARALLARAAQIERDMAGYAAGVRGHVRVLATQSAIAESLADDVAAFLKAPGHQHIRIDMEEAVSTQVLRAVREGSASLGICWDAADLRGLHHWPWRGDRLAVVMPPGHALARRKRLALADTLPYEQVSLPPESAVQVMLQRAAALAGQPIRYRVVAATFDAALRVVRSRLAIAILPAELSAPYAEAFELRVTPLTDAWAQRRFAIACRDPEALTPAARLLVEHLVAAAKAAG